MRSPSLNHGSRSTGRRASEVRAGDDDWRSLAATTGSRIVRSIRPGRSRPTPRVLQSGRLEVMIQALLTAHDHVMINAPPVLGLADAPMIGSSVIGLLRGRGERDARPRHQCGDRPNRSAKGHIIGAVLTKFDSAVSRLWLWLWLWLRLWLRQGREGRLSATVASAPPIAVGHAGSFCYAALAAATLVLLWLTRRDQHCGCYAEVVPTSL